MTVDVLQGDPLVTIAEINTLTNTTLSTDYPDVYVNAMIRIVSQHARAYCMGTLFQPVSITGERRECYVGGRTNQLTVRLRYAPLISVTSLSYRVGSTDTLITNLANADLDLPNAEIRLIWYGPMWRRKEHWIIISNYMAGYTTIPEEVKLGTAYLVREWLDAEKKSAASPYIVEFFQIGDYSEKYSISAGMVGNIGMGTKRSVAAQMLLKPYRRPGVA